MYSLLLKYQNAIEKEIESIEKMKATWAAKRCEMHHPAPWALVEVLELRAGHY